MLVPCLHNNMEPNCILNCSAFRSIWLHYHKLGENLAYKFFRYSKYKMYQNTFFFNNICLLWNKFVLPIFPGVKLFPLVPSFVWERWSRLALPSSSYSQGTVKIGALELLSPEGWDFDVMSNVCPSKMTTPLKIINKDTDRVSKDKGLLLAAANYFIIFVTVSPQWACLNVFTLKIFAFSDILPPPALISDFNWNELICISDPLHWAVTDCCFL